MNEHTFKIFDRVLSSCRATGTVLINLIDFPRPSSTLLKGCVFVGCTALYILLYTT
ncbi:hypothetical protein BT69DRAFT_54644 [Atractiella rhizophila]|nr:hypothetical protein BT69DRAFT_54644 [Atractiella rhizophila]